MDIRNVLLIINRNRVRLDLVFFSFRYGVTNIILEIKYTYILTFNILLQTQTTKSIFQSVFVLYNTKIVISEYIFW